MERTIKVKAMPWLIILFGFLSLAVLPPMFGWLCILLGVVIKMEQIWPEKFDDKKDNRYRV